jgi:hypothetical protein
MAAGAGLHGNPANGLRGKEFEHPIVPKPLAEDDSS